MIALPNTPIKSLSLRQPWLHAIFTQGKRIENRKWPCSYRGPIWLHAAKGTSEDERFEALSWMASCGLLDPLTFMGDANADYDYGGVCGYAEIEGVLYPDGHELAPATLASFYSNVPNADEVLRWKFPAQFGFVLKNVKRFPLIPCAGKQRWFYLAHEVEKAARAALRAA